jgi:RNA polymerase sigma-70 factor (ECF subfamily)
MDGAERHDDGRKPTPQGTTPAENTRGPEAAGDAPVSATDEELLSAARRGDEDAFPELVERHAERLFRLAFGLVGRRADAEDVVQETLVGAFEHIRRFEGRSTVKTWLTGILLRQAARRHRRRGRRRESPRPEMDAAAPAPGRPAASAADLRMDVARALEALSPDHRQVVVLREFEGMSYAEMADALGVPQGTVESRLYRARQKLKELLRDYVP